MQIFGDFMYLVFLINSLFNVIILDFDETGKILEPDKKLFSILNFSTPSKLLLADIPFWEGLIIVYVCLGIGKNQQRNQVNKLFNCCWE